jgi:hypothetical protein
MKKICIWFLVCLFVFIASTFLHECGHGFASKLNGVSVSSGFNRVGNAYKYPSEDDFRTDYDSSQNSLLDFGVPITLVLASCFTLLFCLKEYKKEYITEIILSIALCNSLIRLVPSTLCGIIPIFTGEIHIEDEIETGKALAERLGVGWLITLPVAISFFISIICYFACMTRMKRIHFVMHRQMMVGLWIAYAFSFIIENFLDNIFRINWVV